VSSSAAPDLYHAVEDGPETEWKVKGSRFLGQVFRIADEAGAASCLQTVRKKHHAATHHCWALRVGSPEAVVERSDDAGEPSGTAGRPILNQLLGQEIHDVLLVVTRYFGGTKLGTGGLARAYADAAAMALAAAPRRIVRLETRLSVTCDFDDLGFVEAILAREAADVRVVERDYSRGPRLTLFARRSRAEEIADVIIETTSGRAKVRIG
jgi:uncharacterized YigZ family protein